MPVAKQRSVLWAYSAHIMKDNQEAGLLAVMHLRVVSRSWFTLSVWPFDSVWNPDDRLTIAPKSWQNACQNREENWGPQSETMSCGMPTTWKTWLMINSAVSLAVGNLGKGMNLAALKNLSIMTIMTVLPWDGGSPVMKSMERCDQDLLGIGRGWSNSWGQRWEPFPWLHVGQALTKDLVSSLIVGHQNFLWRNSRVRLVPGWQVRRESNPTGELECEQI